MTYYESMIEGFEAISVDGFTLSLLIILLGKGLIEDWFTHTNLSKSWTITTTPTSYLSNDIANR